MGDNNYVKKDLSVIQPSLDMIRLKVNDNSIDWKIW